MNTQPVSWFETKSFYHQKAYALYSMSVDPGTTIFKYESDHDHFYFPGWKASLVGVQQGTFV